MFSVMDSVATNAQNSDAHRELTSTGRILLGMIAEGHRTGYAIKAEIERSTRHFWGASIGGIYPGLKRLADEGLVAREDDPRGEGRRHSYQLTVSGEAVLRDWLTHPAEEPVELRDEGLLKLRFAEVLTPDERTAVVRRMGIRHREQARRLRRQLAAREFDDSFDRLSTEYLLGWNEWAEEWCDRVLESLGTGEPDPASGK